jgi:hypothetical protein
MKDLATRSVIARYDSSSSLYVIPLFASATFSIDALPYALAAAASTSTWHRRLGHLGPVVLSQLSHSSVITCPRASSESLCHACQLGHHIRLPFPSSSFRVVRAFDLIHCDLWTSPLPSVSGYKYYLVILDDCTHHSWTFPLRHNSDTFSTHRHACLDCKVIPEECVVPQHKFVIADFRSRVRLQRSKHVQAPRMKWWKLKVEATKMFKERVLKKGPWHERGDANSMWMKMSTCIRNWLQKNSE